MFRNLSKNVPAGASSARDEPRAASEGTFDGKAEAASNATFDGKAEAEGPADKTSIGLSARLARASMSNLNAGNKSQRGQGSQRGGSSARGQSSNRAPSKDDDASAQHL
jgi:hypothetical protein